MRIFVMFGTQDKRFDRLLNAILNSNFVNENEVYVQLGYTKGDYSGINGQEYYTEDELNHQIEIADLIITHAGVGAIVSALKLTVNNAYNFEPKEYVADKHGIIDEITDFINTL